MSRPRGGTPATTALERAGVSFVVHDFGEQPIDPELGYGRAAAAALGVDEDRVFKTLLVAVTGSGGPTNRSTHHAVAIVPASTQLGLKAMATALGVRKVEMLDAATAERITGYVVGGISPFGQRAPTRGERPTIIDVSCGSHETVFVSGGKRGLDIEISPADLTAVLRATTAPIGVRH